MKKNKKNDILKSAIITIIVLLLLGGLGFLIYIFVFNSGCPVGQTRKGTCLEIPGANCPCIDSSKTKWTSIDKPIIYLYPDRETEVSVKLGSPEKITASYPEYSNGWNVLAEPDGKLINLENGRELYGLYWEGKNQTLEMTRKWFVVKSDEVVNFLEEKLTILGLNEREAEEFIVYWLPKMKENEWNYVRFASSEEIEESMPLYISPKPDVTIRVLMLTKKLDNPIEVEEQILGAAPERNGFTVVEWGGSVIDND